MPACEPWCPLVKAQLKKIATEAPWILKKADKGRETASDIEDERFVSAISDAASEIEDEKFVSAISDARRDDDEKVVEVPKIPGFGYRRFPGDTTGRPFHSFEPAVDPTKDVVKSQLTMLSDDKTETETPTEWSVFLEGSERSVEIDADQSVEIDSVKETTKYMRDLEAEKKKAIKKVDEIDAAKETTKHMKDSEAEKKKAIKKVDEIDAAKETTKHMKDSEAEKKKAIKKVDKDEREDIAMSRDECDPSCPRRIPRKTRIRKLEERQRMVDSYLLNKGTGYFEDVCTCSLACVVRALSHDSFVRSMLTSAIVFTLGLKLCSELDAWYLPVRL